MYHVVAWLLQRNNAVACDVVVKQYRGVYVVAWLLRIGNAVACIVVVEQCRGVYDGRH